MRSRLAVGRYLLHAELRSSADTPHPDQRQAPIMTLLSSRSDVYGLLPQYLTEGRPYYIEPYTHPWPSHTNPIAPNNLGYRPHRHLPAVQLLPTAHRTSYHPSCPCLQTRSTFSAPQVSLDLLASLRRSVTRCLRRNLTSATGLGILLRPAHCPFAQAK